MKHYTVLFLRKDDQLLLAMKKRGFGAGRWNGVGGKVEPGETVKQAAVREAQEEISVTPKRFHQVAIHDFLFADGSGMQVYAFVCDTWEGRPIESEEMRPQWFTISDIPYTDMWQDDIMWLPFVLAGQHLRCTFTFDADDNVCSADIAMVSFPKGTL